MLALVFGSNNRKETGDVLLDSSLLAESIRFTKRLADGDVQAQMPIVLSGSSLGKELARLQHNFNSSHQAEENRIWIGDGIVALTQKLNESLASNDNDIFSTAFSFLTKRVDAFQGSLFLLRPNDLDVHPDLTCVASFATNGVRSVCHKIGMGEGLLGQCVLDKTIMHVTDVPPDYFRISSGLGTALPAAILIVPIVVHHRAVGAMEFSFFGTVQQYRIELLTRSAELIGGYIVQQHEKESRASILELTKRQADELLAKEKLMQSQLRELEEMQRELSKNEVRLKSRLVELEQALLAQKESEILRIREEEKALLESKLEAQKISYELIIDRLKAKLQSRQT